ncbi:MAG: ATP-binding protein [Oscillospiraceae bacterium]|nr:ATP-binding protein [Oscillospiraceae bacterium]
MRNKIIFVTGCPAAGKSTFALRLSEKLNIPLFSKDIIKEIMGDGYGSESGEVYKTGSKVTFMLMLHIAEQFLQTGQKCILESNFLHHDSEQIKLLLKKNDCDCLTFMFGGNLDVLGERYFNRDKERHWVHGKAENKESIKNYVLKTKILEVSFGGEVINVNATSFDKIDYEGLFVSAKRFIDNCS